MTLYSGRKIRIYLFLTIFVLAIFPLSASFYFLKDVVEGSLGLGLNQEVGVLLEKSQDDLKQLKNLQESSWSQDEKESMRKRFFELQEKKELFKNSDYIKQKLKLTYMTYYFVGVLAMLLIASFAAFVLGGKIARSYERLFEEHKRKALLVQEVENFEQWRRMARKLAHEIKNSLTPIEMMVSMLERQHSKRTSESFRELLLETRDVVGEELGKLKRMVHNFSAFARLPDPEFELCDFADYLRHYIEHFAQSWPNVHLMLKTEEEGKVKKVKLDKALFRQVLTNLINNAREANPMQTHLNVEFRLQGVWEKKRWSLQIINDGASIERPSEVFKLYFSTKSGKDNMGLGLPIVKKIVMDHGGDISVMNLHEGAGFLIDLPISTDLSKGDE